MAQGELILILVAVVLQQAFLKMYCSSLFPDGCKNTLN
jgi:hypothetical protein